LDFRLLGRHGLRGDDLGCPSVKSLRCLFGVHDLLQVSEWEHGIIVFTKRNPYGTDGELGSGCKVRCSRCGRRFDYRQAYNVGFGMVIDEGWFPDRIGQRVPKKLR
jgi:hypothetical protein